MADNKVNFLRGTSAEYEASAKDNDVFYYTTDDEKLYLGETEITGGGVIIDNTLSDASKNPVQNKVITNALNAKANLTDIPTSLPANGGNADTVNNHTVKSDVPENAKFTDTKVTSVDNHYEPIGNITTSASGGTLTDISKSSSGVQVVTGVIKDEAGHVTGVTSAALKSTNDTYGVATSSTLGLVKSGTDITVAKDGNVSVNDNSHKHTVSNISDLTATAAELNVLDGITATTAELNYTDGVTGNIQTQLNAKAALASPIFTGTPKAPTASAGTNTTQIATTAFVQTAVSNGLAASDAMIIKGTIGTNGTVTALPTTYKTGWTYRVITPGTYAGQVCEIGDLIIALVDRAGSGNANSDWCVAQTNINGAITGVRSGDAYIDARESGSVVTITHKDVTRTNTTSTAKPSQGGTFTAVKSVTSDAKGHVTAVDTETVTIPAHNAFSNVKVGSTTIAADTTTDTIEIAGSNVTLTPDATNDKLTIGITKSNVTSALGYTPPTTDENVKNELKTTTKAYVTGTTSATTNTGTQVFDTGVYLDTTAGQLTATTFKGALSGNATSADTVDTVKINPSTGTWYAPTFVDSNNSSATPESVKTNPYFGLYLLAGTTSAIGKVTLALGNNKGSGVADNAKGQLLLHSEGTGCITLTPGTTSSGNFTLTLPAKNGTIATTDVATQSANGLMSSSDKKILDILKTPYVECTTSQATAAKTATLANFTLTMGSMVVVKFTDKSGTEPPSSTSLTLNINNTGAKNIVYTTNGVISPIMGGTGLFSHGHTHIFLYQGSWLCLDWNKDTNTDEKVKNELKTTTKAYITGTTSNKTNTGTQVFDTSVYLDTTAGQLVAKTFKGDLSGTAENAIKIETFDSSGNPYIDDDKEKNKVYIQYDGVKYLKLSNDYNKTAADYAASAGIVGVVNYPSSGTTGSVVLGFKPSCVIAVSQSFTNSSAGQKSFAVMITGSVAQTLYHPDGSVIISLTDTGFSANFNSGTVSMFRYIAFK